MLNEKKSTNSQETAKKSRIIVYHLKKKDDNAGTTDLKHGCKAFFTKTLNRRHGPITTELKGMVQSGSFATEDHYGKQQPSNKISEEICMAIRKHIIHKNLISFHPERHKTSLFITNFKHF